MEDKEPSDIAEVRRAYAEKKAQLIAETRLLIFGPARNNNGYESREALRLELEEAGCSPKFAEDILKFSKLETATGERMLAESFDLIFVLLSGVGPILEFGMFMVHDNIARKFRVFQDSQYKESRSYVNEVLKLFCGNYRQCFTFSSEKELRQYARETLDYYVLWKMTVA
ncbi:MAG: hypothetical protein JRN20_13735 [Nitrososphaerota archaeon]|nr:hypothetical protein [Nitrososphaerota archaeon]